MKTDAEVEALLVNLRNDWNKDRAHICAVMSRADELISEQRAEIARLTDTLNKPVLLSEWQQAQQRIAELEGALRELVECKRLKDVAADVSKTQAVRLAAGCDYTRQKPKAWDAARAALAPRKAET